MTDNLKAFLVICTYFEPPILGTPLLGVTWASSPNEAIETVMRHIEEGGYNVSWRDCHARHFPLADDYPGKSPDVFLNVGTLKGWCWDGKV